MVDRYGTRDAPILWTIAGSDSSGGAGIAADLKTASALGCHAHAIVTAVTAQSSRRVEKIEPVSTAMLRAQWFAARADDRPRAVKSGMLAGVELAELAAEVIAAEGAPYVCDPVLVATSGDRLAPPAAIAVYRERLLPLATVVTPNRFEAEALLGRSIRTAEDVTRAAHDLLELGAKGVVIKGGHAPWPSDTAADFFTDGQSEGWLVGPRYPVDGHGTGCVLSAAITAGLAKGLTWIDALVMAKAYVTRAVRLAYRIGHGVECLRHLPWPAETTDFPWLVPSAFEPRLAFAPPGAEPLGFYPIVPRAAWLERLLPLGVRTIQLRVKDLSGIALKTEVERAVALCRARDVRLFINDHWQLALEVGAYGVHLGQEDLAEADLSRLARSGVRLGISTHSYAEAARAHALGPSYVALGPIAQTTCKAMRFGPQGVERIEEWATLLPYPLVAIGGLKLADAEEIWRRGARGVAVISDVLAHPTPENQARRWLEALARLDAAP